MFLFNLYNKIYEKLYLYVSKIIVHDALFLQSSFDGNISINVLPNIFNVFFFFLDRAES
jgi:hypothetical protein